MKEEQYLFIENTLRELSFYIHQCRVEEKKEEYKKQFIVLKPNAPAPMRNNVVSKLNKKKKEVWTAEEIKEMPYLKDLTYRQTKDGIHQFRYRRDGYNLSFNSKNYETAKKKAYDFIKGLKRIVRSAAESVYGKTLDYVASAWLELKKNHVAAGTFRVYEGVYNTHIKSTFGERKIKNILPIDLQPYFDELYAKYPRKCEDVKIILNGVFEYAVANRLCPSNPIKGVVIEKHYRKNGKSLSNEQIERFKTKMLNDGYFGIGCLIILFTGIRGFELQSLSFNWENGTFTVNNAKLKKSQKANEENITRTVPIFPVLWSIKKNIEEYGEKWKINPGTLTCKFSEHWNECTVKDLRHTFTSKARESGVENELVNLWTGHLPGKNVTANIYTHFSMDYQKKEAEKVKI